MNGDGFLAILVNEIHIEELESFRGWVEEELVPVALVS